MKTRQTIIILSILALIVAALLIWRAYQDTGTGYVPVAIAPVTDNGEPVECYTNADCIITGCSNTVCADRAEAAETVTTCEYRDEYTCFNNDNCICRDNTCNWGGNEAFQKCVKDFYEDPCAGLDGAVLAECQAEERQSDRCTGFVGVEYITCIQSLYADTEDS